MIWPWSTIARLELDAYNAERGERAADYEVMRLQREYARANKESITAAENMQLLMAENEMLRDERKSLRAQLEIQRQESIRDNDALASCRAQLAAKIGMGSAYNPDNPLPGVSDAASRPVFPTPPKVSRPKRVRK